MMELFEAVVEALKANPGAMAAVAAVIVTGAITSSELVNGIKAVLNRFDLSMPPLVAKGLCFVGAVLVAIPTLLVAEYPWPIWLGGLVLAAATGPAWHNKRSADQSRVNRTKEERGLE